MPETVCVDTQHNVILIESSGHVAENDLKQSLASVLEITRDQGLNKVLVDTTHQTTLPSIMALHEFASELSKQVSRLEHAIVTSKQSAQRMEFIETVGRNRGMSMKLFSSREEALSWLNRSRNEPDQSMKGTA